MQRETVTYLRIEGWVDFEAQPFKVVDDEAMQELDKGLKPVGGLALMIVSEDNMNEILKGGEFKEKQKDYSINYT